jgi:cytochrome c oxidase subunit 2
MIPVWFIPTKTGDYEIACAQLCGLGHYRMRGYLTVETQEEYDAWIKDQESYLEDDTASSDEQ